MKRMVVRGMLAAGAAVALVFAAGCNGQAPPMTPQEQKAFEGHMPASAGEIMRNGPKNFHGRPAGGQQPGNGGPGGPPAGAVPSGPPPTGAPK